MTSPPSSAQPPPSYQTQPNIPVKARLSLKDRLKKKPREPRPKPAVSERPLPLPQPETRSQAPIEPPAALPKASPTKVISAAQPSRIIFDPWNVSTTGHQTFQNRLASSSGYREQRTQRTNEQFNDKLEEGEGRPVIERKRKAEEDSGAGSQENDDHDAARSHKRHKPDETDGEAPPDIWRSVRSLLGTVSPNREVPSLAANLSSTTTSAPITSDDAPLKHSSKTTTTTIPSSPTHKSRRLPLFFGLTFYINGSTAPMVSDHRLKYLIAEHGGTVALGLARRSVTHVVLGKPADGPNKEGAGGGLAAGKLQKEVTARRGSVRFVRVEWVLDCIEAKARLPEAAYAPVSTALKGVESVWPLVAGEGGAGR